MPTAKIRPALRMLVAAAVVAPCWSLLVAAPASAATITTYTVRVTFKSVNFVENDDSGVAPMPFPPFIQSSCDPAPAKSYKYGSDKACYWWTETYARFSAATTAANKGTSLPHRQIGKWGNGCFSSSGVTNYLYNHGECPSIVDTRDYNAGGAAYPCWLDSINRVFCTPGQSSPGRYDLSNFEVCRSATKPSSTSPACSDPLYKKNNNYIDLAVHTGEAINLEFAAYDYDNASADDLIQSESGSFAFTDSELANLNKDVALKYAGDVAGSFGGVVAHLQRFKTVQENPYNFTISDFATTDSPMIVVGETTRTVSLTVGITIYHTYRGDLSIDLVRPDGVVHHLKSAGADPADNYITTIGLTTTMQSGVWHLRVTDVNASDIGYLDTWSMTY